MHIYRANIKELQGPKKGLRTALEWRSEGVREKMMLRKKLRNTEQYQEQEKECIPDFFKALALVMSETISIKLHTHKILKHL